MSSERAPINVLLHAEQSAGEVSVIESGSHPGFGGPLLHHHAWALLPSPESSVIGRRIGERPGDER